MRSSILVPIRNGQQHLPLFLSSLRSSHQQEDEIILIDDASDAPAKAILQDFSAGAGALLLRNEEPEGFASAVNRGVREAKGDIIIICNSDLILNSECLECLAREVIDKNAGVVAPILLYPQNERIQHAGLLFSATNHYHFLRHSPFPKTMATAAREVQAVAFALCALRRRTFAEIGELNEKYLNGYEDIDYCFRLRAAGLRLMVLSGETHAHHWERQAGHARSAARKDNIARLWRDWGNLLVPDHLTTLLSAWERALQAKIIGQAGPFAPLDLTRSPGGASVLQLLRSNDSPLALTKPRHFRQDNSQGEIWLPMILPPDYLRHEDPYLYVTDSWIDLEPNHYWFALRRQFVGDELIADTFGNLIPTSRLLQPAE